MSGGSSHLVQILLPKETGAGQPVSQKWFDAFMKELTDKFGGRDELFASTGTRPVAKRGATEKDRIAVVEVMVEQIDPAFWRSLRETLERELSQEEIIIRAQEIVLL